MPSRQPSVAILTADAGALIETVTPEQLVAELEREAVVVIDLRQQAERLITGSIPGAVHVPSDMLVFYADPALPVHAGELDRARRLVLYCASGHRSALAVLMLRAMAYPEVAHLEGGFEGWRRAGGTVDLRPRAEAP